MMSRVDLTERDSKFNHHLESLSQIKKSLSCSDIGLYDTFYSLFLVDYMVLDTKIPWHRWLPCLTLGVIPTSILYAFGGHAIIAGNMKQLMLIVLLALILLAIYKRFEKERLEARPFLL